MKSKSLLYTLLCLLIFIVGYTLHSMLTIKDTGKPIQTTKQEKQIKIGVMQLLSHEALDTIYRGFTEEMERLGYSDGEQISIQLQNAQGDQSNLATMSQKLADETDVLIGITTPSSISLAKATREKPIVLAGVSYPVQSGLMASEQASGNNITGVAHRTPIQEQFELMLKVMPQMKKIGFLYTANEDNAVLQIEEAKEVAKKLGLTIELASITNTNDLQQVTESLATKVDAVFLPVDNTIAGAMAIIIAVTDKHNIPVFPSAETMVADGGVLSIGVDQYKIGVEVAKVAVKIIQGEKPQDIPLVIPTGDTVYLNEEKAKQLNLIIPQAIRNAAQIIQNKK